nr:MAG TPA: hypothetical protein [Caudoviricetes sp.]
MIVRDLITNATVTAAGILNVGSISPGIYRPIRFEQTSAVTSIFLRYSRNGAGIEDAKIVPYENSVVDLSTVAALYPSVAEATMNSTDGWNFADTVAVNYVEGGTGKSLNLRVINVASANARFASKSYTGGLSDYANGKFNAPNFRLTKASPLTGVPFANKIIYGQTSVNDNLKSRGIGISGSATVLNGATWGLGAPGTEDRELLTNTDTTWGYVRFERKYPYCPDPNKRVTLRWLNSYGLYDTMFFDQYRIVPTYLVNYSGGNRILSYEVTVGTTVTADNEKALLQLSRTTDVAGVFPIDTTQWARVTIMNPTAFNAQGGALGRAVNFKCKFEILEP